MPKHCEKRVVPFSAEQMFTLVSEVDKYVEFLPWCQNSQIIIREENSFIADLTIGYKSFDSTFRSRVHLKPFREIYIEYMEGKMNHLKNSWQFQDLSPQLCEINFFIDFSFYAPFLKFAVESIFMHSMTQIIHAFEKRAQDIYPQSII